MTDRFIVIFLIILKQNRLLGAAELLTTVTYFAAIRQRRGIQDSESLVPALEEVTQLRSTQRGASMCPAALQIGAAAGTAVPGRMATIGLRASARQTT